MKSFSKKNMINERRNFMEVINNLIINVTVLFIIAIPFIVFCYIITLVLKDDCKKNKKNECKKCNTKNETDANYCKCCGEKLRK